MSRDKIVLFGIVALIVLTGCLGGTGGDAGDGNVSDGVGGEEGADEATVAVAFTFEGDEIPGVVERLNLSRTDQLLVQRAQQPGSNLTAEEEERVQEIQQEAQSAQQEIRQEREQAMREAREGFEATVNSTQTLSVEDSIQQGQSSLFLVSGSPSEILSLLDESGVQAIIGEEQYNQLRQQQQQQPPGGGGTPQPQPTPSP